MEPRQENIVNNMVLDVYKMLGGYSMFLVKDIALRKFK
jgi:hypothetical protein